MGYSFPFADYRRTIRNLQQVTQWEGSPWTLDTPSEREKASQIVRRTLQSLEATKPHFWQRPLAYFQNIEAIEAIKAYDLAYKQLQSLHKLLSGEENLYIHPHFDDTFLKGSPVATVVSEKEDHAFTVYHAGGGYLSLSAEIFVGTKEWEFITDPFQNMCLPPEKEREAVRLAISRFERIVGPKAGTDKDIGGFEGNKPLTVIRDFQYIAPGLSKYNKFETPPVEKRFGQQDCINELQTVRPLLGALELGGFLQSHALDFKYVKTMTHHDYHHYAPILHDKVTHTSWVVDAWLHHHGELPDVMTETSWRQKYKPREESLAEKGLMGLFAKP